MRFTLVRTEALTRGIQKRGVTLLELMVALGLLAMLLLVAWSLFDNLQKAEGRSEGLAYRVQVLRQIRSWLTEDLDQLVFPRVDDSGTIASSSDIHFVGDPTGFIATINPSLDPLPFLQDAFESSANDRRSLAAQSPQDEIELASVYDTDQDRQVRSVLRSQWGMEKINIEYVLETQSNANQNTTSVQSDAIMYNLVRRERLPLLSGTTAVSGSVPPAERQLTIRDLYRQTDEAIDNRGPTLREKSLKGIQNAQFRYFDGTAWISQWDSRKQNGFPMAVAIQFDFPSRSQARRDKAQRASNANSSIEAEVSSEQSFGSIDTLLTRQSIVEPDTGDSQNYLVTNSNTEVTIVVITHFRPTNGKDKDVVSDMGGNTRNNQRNSSGSSP